MSATRSTSSCTFTFSDGRRCRALRQSGHPLFCSMHALRQDRAGTAETLGREFAQFFSRRYLSACDLNAALGSLFTATIRGHVPPKTTRTLAYLAQVMVQCIRLTEHEYADTYGGDGWRRAVRNSVNSNFDHHCPAASVEAGLQPGSSNSSPSSVAVGLHPGSSNTRSVCVGVGLQPGLSSNSSCTAPPLTVRQPEPPQPSQSIAPPSSENPALNAASLPSAASTVITSQPAPLPPAPLQPALTLNLPAQQPSATPASSPGAVSSTMNTSSNHSTGGSLAASLKSQLKHLLVSELSKPAAPGPTSPQPVQSVPKVSVHPTNVETDVDGGEEMDDDGDDDFYGGARVPALRRRSWRERV